MTDCEKKKRVLKGMIVKTEDHQRMPLRSRSPLGVNLKCVGTTTEGIMVISDPIDKEIIRGRGLR